MISALAALLSMVPAAEPVSLVPTDDVWVYSHATDQTSDQHLRVWGSESGPTDGDEGSYSMSFLKFSLPEGLDPAKLESAKIVVYSIPDVAWTSDSSKLYPLQARRVEGDFTEEKWDYSKASTLVTKAGEAEVYGFGSGTPGADKPFAIEIDLLKGKADFREALKNPKLSIALTTAMSPLDAQGSLYKVFSRNAAEEELRPRLVLKFAD